MLGSQIDDNVANSIVSQLLFLQDSEKDIYLYINHRQCNCWIFIYDTIQHIKPDVQTILVWQASMGSFLLAAGAKGKRALPNAEGFTNH